MTELEIVRAIAELDGWNSLGDDAEMVEHWIQFPREVIRKLSYEEIHKQRVWRLPDYLTSRDAIIPVIEKHNHFAMCLVYELDMIRTFSNQNFDIPSCGLEWWLLCRATPAQLCEALLRATGKWIE